MNAAPPRGIACRVLLRLCWPIAVRWALGAADGAEVRLHAVRWWLDRLLHLVVDRALERFCTARGPAESAGDALGSGSRWEVAQIERLAHGDIEEASRIGGNCQICERLDLFDRKTGPAGKRLVVGIGSIVVEVASEPGGDGASDGAGNVQRFAWENGKVVVESLWVGRHIVV